MPVSTSWITIFSRDFQIIKPFQFATIFLNPGENIVYVDSATEDLEFAAFSDVDGSQGNKPGRRRKISTLDEFYMVLVRLRLGLFELKFGPQIQSACFHRKQDLHFLDQFLVLKIWLPQQLAGQRDNRQGHAPVIQG